MPGASNVGQSFRDVRKFLRLTQKELAFKLGRSKVAISSIEQGTFGVSTAVAECLADFLSNNGYLSVEEKLAFQRDLIAGSSPLKYLENASATHQPAILLRRDNLDLLDGIRPAQLVGRETEIALINQRLDNNERVLVEGFPGIGKTALVATIATQRALEDKEPILWLEIGRGTAQELIRAIVAPVDRKDRAKMMSDDEVSGFARDELRKRKIQLVILEDVWKDERTLNQLIKAIPQQTPVLITSRYRYKIGNQKPITLQQLASESAVELLKYHAEFDNSDIDFEGSADLCQQLGNHPLAIKFAGGILANGQHTPQSLVNSLESRFHAIPRVFFGDQRTISALLDESLDQLDVHYRMVFLAIGALYARQCPPELISEYMKIVQVDTEAKVALLDLEHRNLVSLRLENHRIRTCSIHALAFSYARDLNIRERRDHRSAIQACMNYARRWRKDLDELHNARDNLIGAAVDMLASGDMEDELMELMWLLVDARYFDAKGYTRSALEPLAHAAQFAEDRALWTQAHYLWTKLGNANLLFLNQYPEAEKAFRSALRLAQQLDIQEEIARRKAILLTLIGVARLLQGDNTEAVSLFEAAEETAASDPLVLSQIYEHRGHMYAQIYQDFKTAWSMFSRSLDFADLIDDHARRHERRFFALINLGGVQHDLKNYSESLKYNLEALELVNGTEYDLWRAFALNEVGEQQLALGLRDEAARHLCQALEVFKDTGEVSREQKLRLFMEQQGLYLSDC